MAIQITKKKYAFLLKKIKSLHEFQFQIQIYV